MSITNRAKSPLMKPCHHFLIGLCIALGTANAHGQMTPGTAMGANDATDYFQKSLPAIYYNAKRYGHNTAYLLLDQNGNLVGRKPVGIDEDDIIVVIIAYPTEGKHDYTITLTGDDYDPVDLRTTDKLQSTEVKGKDGEKSWSCVRFDFGPYTSDKVGISILDNKVPKATYSIRINDLYHVFVGAAFVSSQLEDPSFGVFPLNDKSNTIKSFDAGHRTIATANVTWYWWPTLRHLFKGDNVTRGRDILKEPDFLERFNPTFGVGISEKVFENFFLGGSFEFARGGAIIMGGHYGKATRLVDRDFRLGETVFDGTDTDIRTERINQWGLFFGISLDTRLVTALGQR